MGRSLDAVFTQGIILKEVLEADNSLRTLEEVAAHLLYSEFNVLINQAPGPEMASSFDVFEEMSSSSGHSHPCLPTGGRGSGRRWREQLDQWVGF